MRMIRFLFCTDQVLHCEGRNEYKEGAGTDAGWIKIENKSRFWGGRQIQ